MLVGGMHGGLYYNHSEWALSGDAIGREESVKVSGRKEGCSLLLWMS